MRIFAFILLAGVLLACTSRDVGPYAPSAEDKSNEQLAANNAFCAFENQEKCAHVIENRILLSRFFAPKTLGGMDESEKFRGRRVTTRFVVEAAASIQQCNRVNGEAVTILKDMDIAGRKWQLKASKPAIPTASCFLMPDPEAS
ncbi:MAG: hypothetical protein AAF217_06730 [Pseudomonadota bacterium]